MNTNQIGWHNLDKFFDKCFLDFVGREYIRCSGVKYHTDNLEFLKNTYPYFSIPDTYDTPYSDLTYIEHLNMLVSFSVDFVHYYTQSEIYYFFKTKEDMIMAKLVIGA